MTELPLVQRSAPHIRGKDRTENIMWDVALALLPAVLASIYFFKLKAFFIIIFSVLAAVGTEAAIQKWTKKEITIVDGSAAVTGLLLALVVPPTVPIWMPIVGSAVAIAIAKHAFGGLGYNIFNPALIGRAFLVAAWPALMAVWILPDGITSASPLGLLKMEGIKAVGYLDLFFGNVAGSLGETSALALLIGAAYLFYKKIIDWRVPAAYIGTVFILILLSGQDVIFHVLAGGLMLGAFFMATDPVTSPITKKGRLIFGVGCGLLTVLFRLYSNMPEGVAFSILLMNAIVPLIDRYTKPKVFG